MEVRKIYEVYCLEKHFTEIDRTSIKKIYDEIKFVKKFTQSLRKEI